MNYFFENNKSLHNEFENKSYESLRKWMVKSQIQFRGITNPKIIKTMLEVPRHLFVPEKYKSQAYEDTPLPIGYGQTISQPYIVALMTELLEPQPQDVVLEIGTGSGYQAVILSKLVKEVHTIERIKELAEFAKQNIKKLNVNNVYIYVKDGTEGLKQKAPFDKIIVTASAPDIPQPLIEQLKEGGKMVIPIGTTHFQTLKLVEKINNKIKISNKGGCIFVKLIGKYGW